MSIHVDEQPVTDYYNAEGPLPDKRVLISYTTEPFYLDPESERFSSRQSMWQAIDIADAFNELGYVVDVYSRSDPDRSPTDFSQYDVLFGFEPNFEQFARAVTDTTTKIYYAIGAHWRWRNPAEQKRLDQLTQRRGNELPPERLLAETSSEELADALVVLGDNYLGDDQFLKRSYLNHVGEKPAYNVRLSSFEFLDCATETREFETARRNCLWFGGSGLVLKGLDRAVEAFAELENVDLYICGPVADNEQFVKEYYEELYETENIHTTGYVNVQSETFEELTQRCGYVLNPSGSGVILPGALITCMHRGLVPIVTTEVDPVAIDWGVLLPDSEPATVRQAVQDASQTSAQQYREWSKNACNKAKDNYTRETFAADIRYALREILDQDSVPHKAC